LPRLSIVPVPLTSAFDPLTVSHERLLALKSLPGRLTLRLPFSELSFFSYLALDSNCTFPAKLGLAGNDPSGALNQPLPSKEPPSGSKTTTGEKLEVPKLLPRETFTAIE